MIEISNADAKVLVRIVSTINQSQASTIAKIEAERHLRRITKKIERKLKK